MSDKPTCKTCRFWGRRHDADYEALCLRHAPVIAGTALPAGYNTHPPQWPKTWEQHWCGDHEPLPEPVV